MKAKPDMSPAYAHQCEAMVGMKFGEREVWTRCGLRPTERHHRLTRARGGRILDEVGETYHLMYLCHQHHRMADGKQAYENGLLLDGYVTTVDGRPQYLGSDEYLTRVYGPLSVWNLRDLEGGTDAGEGLRDET